MTGVPFYPFFGLRQGNGPWFISIQYSIYRWRGTNLYCRVLYSHTNRPEKEITLGINLLKSIFIIHTARNVNHGPVQVVHKTHFFAYLHFYGEVPLRTSKFIGQSCFADAKVSYGVSKNLVVPFSICEYCCADHVALDSDEGTVLFVQSLTVDSHIVV